MSIGILRMITKLFSWLHITRYRDYFHEERKRETDFPSRNWCNAISRRLQKNIQSSQFYDEIILTRKSNAKLNGAPEENLDRLERQVFGNLSAIFLTILQFLTSAWSVIRSWSKTTKRVLKTIEKMEITFEQLLEMVLEAWAIRILGNTAWNKQLVL